MTGGREGVMKASESVKLWADVVKVGTMAMETSLRIPFRIPLARLGWPRTAESVPMASPKGRLWNVRFTCNEFFQVVGATLVSSAHMRGALPEWRRFLKSIAAKGGRKVTPKELAHLRRPAALRK